MTKLFEAKPFIIAEVGSNWETLRHCLESISSAKQAGADAVKFQLFTHRSLYGFDRPEGELASSLPLAWLPKLKEKADACGIEFMCSAFSPELVKEVDKYVEVHKVASSEITHPHLLHEIRATNKPVLISVGASTKGDIRNAIDFWYPRDNEKAPPAAVLLYCAAAYPSVEYNLFQIEDLKAAFGFPVGLSDHSEAVFYTALSAVKHFGVPVIEKHVNFAGVISPDSAHSLDADQFVRMCAMLRGKRDFEEFLPLKEENEMFLRHNRRLIATKPIAKGDTFLWGENFGCYRTLEDDAEGLHSFRWEKVHSRVCLKDLKAGAGIGPSAVNLL